MYFYVYKITNKINSKVYIGVHKTSNLNDNYMGSGKIIKRAIQKYSLENFDKQILKFFESEKEMFDYERLIVNEDFVNSENTYNIKLGGNGGWDFANTNYSNDQRKYAASMGGNALSEKLKSDDNFKNEFCENIKLGLSKSENFKNHLKSDYFKNYVIKFQALGTAAALNNKSKEKRINTFKKNNHQSGNKNSQYGSIWIYSNELRESKKILNSEKIPEGWLKGRIQDFSYLDKCCIKCNIHLGLIKKSKTKICSNCKKIKI